jgi:hypothetical protein
MNTADMTMMMRQFFEAQCMRIFEVKNAAYAQTDVTEDGMDNFKKESASVGIRFEQYWAVLWGKHKRAMETWVRTGVAPAEVYKILCDLIVYELILYCHLVEIGEVDHAAVLKDETN